MDRLAAGSALLALLFLGGAIQSAVAADEQIASSGSGVIIRSDGVVITNAHVVKACSKVVIQRPGDVKTNAELLAKDERNDLALFKANIGESPIATFRMSKLLAGEAVTVFGFPLSGMLSSSGNVTTGIVSALSGVADDSTRMQITAPVQPGNSGGPVFDSSGNVIGLVVSKLDAINAVKTTGDIPQNVNFAIKVPIIYSFLTANDIQTSNDAFKDDVKVTDLIEGAKKYTVRIECYAKKQEVAKAPQPTQQRKNDTPKPQPQPQPYSTAASEAMRRIPYGAIDNLSASMADVILKNGRQEAVRAVQLTFEQIKKDQKPALEIILACIAIDFGIAVIDTSVTNQSNLARMPYFSAEQIERRADILMDKISFPIDQRRELYSKLIQVGGSALSKHMR